MVAGQVQQFGFQHNGISRSYLVRTPEGYDGNQPYPVILLLHGIGGSGNDMMYGTGMMAVADNALDPFILVAPDATIDPFFGTTWWNEGVSPLATTDDAGFISALLDTVSANFSVESRRIYCAGFSDGGFMTQRLACELSDKIAAFASVAGTRASSLICNPGRTVPVFHIHGTADETVGYTGDLLMGSPLLASYFIGVDELISSWISINNCSAEIESLVLGESTEVFKYSPCVSSVETWLYKVNGGAHEWQLTPDFNTNIEIWNFFSDYVLPLGMEDFLGEALRIYPQPSEGLFYLDGIDGVSELKVYDAAGTLLLSESGVNRELNLLTFPKGLYMLHVKMVSGERFTHKLVKQ
jgi:polyhydroxybutyrate depolymerase